MDEIARSTVGFFKSAWGAVCFAALSFVDPVSALQDLGLLGPNWHWDLDPELHRALFLLLAFLWMGVSYHLQRMAFELTERGEPDAPLSLGLSYAVSGNWLTPSITHVDSGLMEDFFDALTKFTQLAAEGRLDCWGHRITKMSGPFEKIPASDWLVKSVSELQALKGEPRLAAEFGDVGGIYDDLKISRKQFERAWRWSNWKRLRHQIAHRLRARP